MKKNLPILYSNKECPYSIRAKMALLLNSQPFIEKEMALNDKLVPSLVLPDGTILEKSMHIMHWAFDRETAVKCREMRENEILIIEQLISENDGPFVHILQRYLHPKKYPKEQNKDWRKEADKFLGRLEFFLKHNPYLFGKTPAIEDLAIMPFVYKFKMADTKWFDETQPYPKVKIWLDKHIKSELFTKVMDRK